MAIHNLEIFKKKPNLLKGNVQIIACAGSGKTEFVSERIAYQIYSKVAKPEQIVAFTFTEKAAEELKFRVRSKIHELMGKQPDIGDMYIGTIHAFAYKVLQDFIPKYRGYDMLDENQRFAFAASLKWDININHLVGSLKKRGFSSRFNQSKENWAISSLLRDVDIYREESLDETAFVSESIKKAIQIYLSKLEEKRFLDFSAILRIAVDTLSNSKAIREKLQKQFQFFTVDEYQDVNPIQEKLIQLISNKKMCV